MREEYSVSQAVEFVKRHGSRIELARLSYLLEQQMPAGEILAEFQASQRSDGGWAPFWAPEASSLDATCFRLAQAEQLGLGLESDLPFVTRAELFLLSRQQEQGYWEEDPALAPLAPAWVKPGLLEARLYLTANCAHWLAKSDRYIQQAAEGANYLCAYLDENGELPSFLHTQWLAASLFARFGWMEKAGPLLSRLSTKLSQFSASDLTWSITSLCSGPVPADHPFLVSAVSRLVELQKEDGRWASDDGEAFDVHVTLEALFALKQCRR